MIDNQCWKQCWEHCWIIKNVGLYREMVWVYSEVCRDPILKERKKRSLKYLKVSRYLSLEQLMQHLLIISTLILI